MPGLDDQINLLFEYGNSKIYWIMGIVAVAGALVLYAILRIIGVV